MIGNIVKITPRIPSHIDNATNSVELKKIATGTEVTQSAFPVEEKSIASETHADPDMSETTKESPFFGRPSTRKIALKRIIIDEWVRNFPSMHEGRKPRLDELFKASVEI